MEGVRHLGRRPGDLGAVALGAVGALIGCRYYKVPFSSFADAVAPGLVVAQAVGRLGNYFNQELFGSPTSLPWALAVYVRTPDGGPGALPAGGICEFPTTYIKASPEVLCGTYTPTFLYEILWNLGVAALVVWADRRFRLGGARAFAVYVAGYTFGRGWIESLRIDPANHFLGLRINVFTSAVLFVAAAAFLVFRRMPREDPATVQGRPSLSSAAKAEDLQSTPATAPPQVKAAAVTSTATPRGEPSDRPESTGTSTPADATPAHDTGTPR